MIEPIKPSQLTKELPEEVIEAANELITNKWTGKKSVFTTDELADTIKTLIREGKKEQLLFRGEIPSEWLDIEDTYRAIGWKVEYKDCGPLDTTPGTYTFTKKK